ncbi:hypothetical protein [Mycolicibacterium sp. XJ870]
MKTVLGLALTSGGVGWVLVDRTASARSPLDDDAFEIDSVDELAARGAAAARGARAIAVSSGQGVRSVGVVWSDGVESEAQQLIDTLEAAGFNDVRVVPSGMDTDADVDELLSVAHAAAHAVATDAVAAREPKTQVHRPDRTRKSATLRVGGAAAAGVVVALLAVGSQSIPERPEPAPEQPALSSAGIPQVVSVVAVPQGVTRRPAVVEPAVDQPATEATVATEATETVDHTPVYEPVEVTAVSAPADVPVAVAHLSGAATSGPATPQLFAPGPVPVVAPVRAPVTPAPPIFVDPFLGGLP